MFDLNYRNLRINRDNGFSSRVDSWQDNLDGEIDLDDIHFTHSDNSQLEEVVRSIHVRIVEDEEEYLTQKVIEALELKGYTVTKNEDTN